MTHNWGYSNDLVTPDQWPKYFRTGQHQSPINILVSNCEHVAQSTCCHHQAKLEPNHAGRLHERLRDSLQVNRRAHLDSTGQDHHRSSSTSSSGSQGSSPNNRYGSNTSSEFEDEDGENQYEQERDQKGDNNQHRHKQYSSTSSKCSSPAKQRAATCCVTQIQNTRHCVSRKKIFLGYPRYLNTMQLCNTGHNWQVNLPPELAAHTLLSGPPLGDREYRLAQFHCHWGTDCDHGSEHQINGKSFAAEIHFVHWNCTDYDSMEEASKHKHGLAVLAVLVQALDGEHNQNKHLEKIISGLRRIHKPNSSLSINTRLDLKKLFPTNRWSYASYEGSLTTPPLSEVVDWIVFLNPIQCSSSQVEEFRHIRCPTSGASTSQLLNNCRPVQPINNRLVSIWTHH